MNFCNCRKPYKETFIEDLEQFVKLLEAYMRDFSPSFSVSDSFWSPEMPDMKSAFAIFEHYEYILTQARLLNASGDWTSFIYETQKSFKELRSLMERFDGNFSYSKLVVLINEKTMELLVHLQERFRTKAAQARLSLATGHDVTFFVEHALSVTHLLIRIEEILSQDYAEIMIPFSHDAEDGAEDDINDDSAQDEDAKDIANKVANEEIEDDIEDDEGKDETKGDRTDEEEELEDDLEDHYDLDDLSDWDNLNTDTACPSPETSDDEKYEDSHIEYEAPIFRLRGGDGSSYLALSPGEERKLQGFPGLHRILRITELFDKYFRTYKPSHAPAPDWTQYVPPYLRISQDFYTRDETEGKNESTRPLSMSQIALEQEIGLIKNLWEELSSFVSETRDSGVPYLRLKYLNTMLKILQQEDCNTAWDNETKRHGKMRELYGLLMAALEDKFLDLKEQYRIFRKAWVNLKTAREDDTLGGSDVL